jgi:hypothetical protein
MKNKWFPSLIQLVGFVAGAAVFAGLLRNPLDYLIDHSPRLITVPLLLFGLIWLVWWIIRDSVRTLVRVEITKALHEALYGDGDSDGFRDDLTRNVVEAMGGDVDVFDQRMNEQFAERQAAHLAETARKYGGSKK